MSQKNCFCLTDETLEVRITVSNGVILSVVRTVDGAPVDTVPRDVFSTIDDLFDLIDRAIELGAEKLDVIYDPVLGYPRWIDIDFIFNAADDEIQITVSELTAI